MKKLISTLLVLSSLSTFAATSEEERANKTFEVATHFGYNYTMGSLGLDALYFIDPNNLVGVKAGSGNDNNDEEKETYFGLQYQHYAGNSFYVKGEAFYLNSTEDVNDFLGDLLNWKDHADYTSLGVDVRIGNQWTWKHLTIGCDWFGLGHRLFTFEKESHDADDVTLTFLNFKIGAIF